MENKEVYKYLKQHIGNESKETIWDNAKVIYEQLTDQEKKKNIYISSITYWSWCRSNCRI